MSVKTVTLKRKESGDFFMHKKTAKLVAVEKTSHFFKLN